MSEIVRSHTMTGIVLTFLAGAATGAAVALLTAPQSGRETRRKLKQATNHLAEKAARVPTALQAAYHQATEAAKEAFVHSWDEPAPQSMSARQPARH